MNCVQIEQYFFYSEEVLPPRCKNLRYRKQLMRRIESIPKASYDEAPVAFTVTERGESRDIRVLNGRLFEKEADTVSPGYLLGRSRYGYVDWIPSFLSGELKVFKLLEPYSEMPQSKAYGDYADGCRHATKWLETHAAIGGELWAECPEPSYTVNAAGIFFVVPDGSFNALERDSAIKTSKSRWERQYKDCSWSESLCCADEERIEVLMPECVKRPRHAEIAEWNAAAKAENLVNSVACIYSDAGLELPDGIDLIASYCAQRPGEIVREVASRLSCEDPEHAARDMLLGAHHA